LEISISHNLVRKFETFEKNYTHYAMVKLNNKKWINYFYEKKSSIGLAPGGLPFP